MCDREYVCTARETAQQGPEKLVEAIDSLEDKVKAFKLQMVDRETEKEVARSTF